MHLQPGQILAEKYRIVRPIGQGGMGAVYEGENVRIHRRVAIKTLHAQVAGKADLLQRFEREAQAAGRIGSEHIVEVLDMGDLPDGSRFMVMEFLEGTTLGDRIVSRGRIPAREVVAPMAQLLEGLGAAHAAGIIHRDLKPANVFLLANKAGRPDFVKILDFGVSKFNVLNSDEMSMTRTGAVMGTPYYMSPEQAKGARAIDTRSDLYSAGVILYEAITGQVPFNAQTFNELIFKIALESPPPPEQFVPNLDPAFGAVLRKAMSREPGERFQTAQELKDALLAWARDFDARTGGGPAVAPAPLPLGGTQLLAGGPHGAAQHGVAQHGVAQHGVPQQGVPQHGALQHGVAQHGAGLAPPQGAGYGPNVVGTEASRPPRSSVGLVIGLLVAATAIGAGAYVLYARVISGPSSASSGRPSEGSIDPASSDGAVTKSRASSAASPTPPTATAPESAAPSGSAATPPSSPPSAIPSLTESATSQPPPTARTSVTSRPPPPPPTGTTKSKGRDIRPDL